jgi:hypothetical protein
MVVLFQAQFTNFRSVFKINLSRPFALINKALPVKADTFLLKLPDQQLRRRKGLGADAGVLPENQCTAATEPYMAL